MVETYLSNGFEKEQAVVKIFRVSEEELCEAVTVGTVLVETELRSLTSIRLTVNLRYEVVRVSKIIKSVMGGSEMRVVYVCLSVYYVFSLTEVRVTVAVMCLCRQKNQNHRIGVV